MHKLIFLLILSYWCTCESVVEPPQPKRRRQVEEIEIKENGAAAAAFPEHPKEPTTSSSRYKDLSECPVCLSSKRNALHDAIELYWRRDVDAAYACACTHLLSKPEDGYATSIVHSLTQGKWAPIPLQMKVPVPSRKAPPIRSWELIGPVNVGKLEHDGDSTFLKHQVYPTYSSDLLDVGEYILGMPSNSTVMSDLVRGGKVKWSNLKTSDGGEVDVRFPSIQWNELVQGLSTMAVYEFQAWARTTTYVKSAGSYLISCSGVHTLYVRNSNVTRVLVGDVYRSGRVYGSVDLRAGLVGLAVALRGVAQTSFRCSVEAADEDQAIIAQPAQNVPDLLEFVELPGKGFLLSSVFTLPVHNVQKLPVSVDFSVVKPLGQEGEYYVREAKPLQDRFQSPGVMEYGNPGEISIAPGQTVYLSLELIPSYYPEGPEGHPSSKIPFLSCRKKNHFQVVVQPSRGATVSVPLDFQCRRLDQTFMISYLDHDHSASQAAVAFPLEYQNNRFKSHAEIEDFEVGGGSRQVEYPVMLTMHGSGIPASNHADAYKVMHPGQKEYTFGVKDFFVVAPSRFGAHNWEHTGELSAIHAIQALKLLLRNTVDFLAFSPKNSIVKRLNSETYLPLPQVYIGSGAASGHSMGAHGAWMVAQNHPDLFSCLAPLSGWVNKEEYGTANAFFHLDASSAFVDPILRSVLHSAMSESHSDKLLHNLLDIDVMVRVGAEDSTTHPWYSRRVHRLLVQVGVNSTYVELPQKQHWWWDTDQPNDGGVLNDPEMRDFYAHCGERAGREHTAELNHASRLTATQTSTGATEADFVANTLPRCTRNVTFSVVNPASHSGMCGLQVLQQDLIMSRTGIQLTCSSVISKPTTKSVQTPVSVAQQRTCVLSTHNIKRLRLRFGLGSALVGNEIITVDGVVFDLTLLRGSSSGTGSSHHSTTRQDSEKLRYCATCASSIPSTNTHAHTHAHAQTEMLTEIELNEKEWEICWAVDRTPIPCDSLSAPLSPIHQKSLANYGPVRQVAARPFCIVYGTPKDQLLRLAVRDLAVYIANAHAAAYSTHVRVYSDLDYIASKQANRPILANIMFIGGPTTNRLMNMICGHNNTYDAVGNSYNTLPLACRIPHSVQFYSGGFNLDGASFDSPEHSAVFTLPFHRVAKSAVRSVGSADDGVSVNMAVCLHANSVQGYLHLSRLAWPVVPPMVRAPFDTYIPDYLVLDSDIWTMGMGAVKKAGYWDNDWSPSATQSFTRMQHVNVL